VTVDVPDAKGRLSILKVHARNKRLGDDVDLSEIAQRTPGFSGADLANLLNEAAILTGRRNKQAITGSEIDDSVDRIVTGMAKQMVINFGFSDIGPWSLMDPSAQSGDMIMRMMSRNSVSESLQQRIDKAVQKIASDAYVDPGASRAD